MANSTDKSILTAAGKALLAQLNAEEKALVIDKMIFANVPNRPEYPQPDDVVPTDHIVHQEQVEQRGRLSADSVIYSTTLTSDVGPFDFNWTGAYCSEYGVLVTIDHHALTPKTADEPGVAGNTLVRSVVLEYKDIAEITNITVDASSWQYNATERMKKMDSDVAQSIIDQNGKDWFIEDGFLVAPSGSAYSIKAGAGYVSGNRVAMEFDRSVQVPNKPSFIYIDAHREGTPTGEQVTLFNFVVTAEEKDDYIDSSTGKDIPHYVCKIAQVLADGSVSDLRQGSLIESQRPSTFNRMFINFKVSGKYSNYHEHGRIFTPHLKYKKSHYLPIDDVSDVTWVFTGTIVDNEDGTITVGTDKGDKIFSAVIAEAMTHNNLPYTDVDSLGAGKGDCIRDTLAFMIAARRGKPIIAKSAVYFLDYLQMSGDPKESHYIGHDKLEIKGVGEVKIVQKSYIGIEPPKNLGINYGYVASTFSLHGFKKVKIKGLKAEGPLFSNLSEDLKPIVDGKGTHQAYNTVSKFISVNFSRGVDISYVETEKFYGSIWLRECPRARVKDCSHQSGREVYLFQDCDRLDVRRLNSYDARFSLEKAALDWADCAVYNRDGSLLYTAIPGAGGDSKGVKLIAGYSFVVAGCTNSKFKRCLSARSGSECYRVQNGPTGKISKRNRFIDCDSDSAGRYALSTRSATAYGTKFIRGGVTNVCDIDVYNQQPPESVDDVLNPIADDETIMTHWQFLLPRDSNAAIYSHGENDEFIDIDVNTKNDMRVTDRAKLKERYVAGFGNYGMSTAIQTFGKNTKVTSNFKGQCTSDNGYLQFFSGSCCLRGSTVETPPGISPDDTVVYCIGLRGNMEKLYIERNDVVGGMYTISPQVDELKIADFRSSRNSYDNTGGVGIFRVASRTDEYRLISYHDSFKGPRLFSVLDNNVSKIERILFDTPVMLTDEFGVNGGNAFKVLRLVLFKHADKYYHRVNMLNKGYPTALVGPRSILFKSVYREDAEYTTHLLPDDEGLITEQLRSADVTPPGQRKLATIYNNECSTALALNVDTDSADGIGSVFYFYAASSAIYDTYYLEYVPLNFDIKEEF